MVEIGLSAGSYDELEIQLTIIQEEIINLPVTPGDDKMQAKLFAILQRIKSIRKALVTVYD